MNKELTTIFGNAHLNKSGYYQITTRTEGNNKKYLHRLIYENYHKLTLLPNAIIHHIDGNSQNNCILNLELVSRKEHNSIHKSGEDCHFYGKHFAGELNGMYGKKHSLDSLIEMSKSKNSSGYFRVFKHKKKKCKQGFTWVYAWHDEFGKRRELSSVDINKLKEKVLSNGLEWIEFSEGESNGN